MKKVKYDGKEYDARHGGPFDRGAADSYYHRPLQPHFYNGGTGTSTLVYKEKMSREELEAYHAGYYWNEENGFKKEW